MVATPATNDDKTAPVLVADIGGTHARFGLVPPGKLQAEQVQRLRGADHPGPAAAARAYLDGAAAVLGASYRPPRQAAFAVATAVTGDHVALTNSGWQFSQAAVQAELRLDRLLVLNDFEAQALSLPHLQPAQWRAIGSLAMGSAHDSRLTLAVIGPGTGLGVASTVPTQSGWHAVPGEGGHATLAPADDFESELLQLARRTHNHVSAERFLSGIGLPLLHASVAQALGVPADSLTAEEIGSRAVAGSDPVCVRTIDVFCAMLGGFAGNVALTVGARGGVYVAGGIAPKLGELFFASRFRERFEAKGRFNEYLGNIPTALITDTQAGLTGAAAGLLLGLG